MSNNFCFDKQKYWSLKNILNTLSWLYVCPWCSYYFWERYLTMKLIIQPIMRINNNLCYPSKRIIFKTETLKHFHSKRQTNKYPLIQYNLLEKT